MVELQLLSSNPTSESSGPDINFLGGDGTANRLPAVSCWTSLDGVGVTVVPILPPTFLTQSLNIESD